MLFGRFAIGGAGTALGVMSESPLTMLTLIHIDISTATSDTKQMNH